MTVTSFSHLLDTKLGPRSSEHNPRKRGTHLGLLGRRGQRNPLPRDGPFQCILCAAEAPGVRQPDPETLFIFWGSPNRIREAWRASPSAQAWRAPPRTESRALPLGRMRQFVALFQVERGKVREKSCSLSSTGWFATAIARL